MPATIVDEPLAVRFVFADGTDWTVRLAGLPIPRLAQDLAVGLAANGHPHGGINKQSTAKGYGVAVRGMVRDLAKNGFNGSASELTRGVLMRYWMASNHTRERNTRQLLKDLDLTTGCLRPDVRAYLAGEPVQARPVLSPYKAYTDAEWERLETTCRRAVDDSYARYKLAVQSDKWGSDPLLTDRDDAEEDIGWLMLRCGPLTYNAYLDYFRARTGEKRGMRKTFSTTGRSAAQQVRDDLFPSCPIMAAYKALLGVYCGVVPDGIADLVVGDVEWAGDATILLSYVKGRTTRESSVLTGPAVRLLEQWLEHSSTLRRFAADDLQEELWIGATEHKADVARDHSKGAHRRKFVELTGLVDDQGRKFSIHGGRIRHTYDERLARRGWTGRALIDPNHSARTEGDHYATPTDPDQLDDIDSIINDGQVDILRKALPPVVLTSERAARFAADFPDEVRRLGLDTAAIAELVGGERDVFTAACTDQLAGVHGPAGKPCPARPWVCLLCPLAVFLPRHASNVLRLDAFFARQFQQMTTEHYLRVFGPYAHRLTHDILPKFSTEAKAKGAQDVAGDDSEIPLRPEEATR